MNKYFWIAIVILSTSGNLYSQNEKRNLHNEVLEGKYIEIPTDKVKTGPAQRTITSYYFNTQVNVDADGNNIMNDAANEPSIAIDPNNPDRMLIGWRQFGTIASSFRQAGYAYTSDGGNTWTADIIDPATFRSDPVLDVDSEGRFYYNSLTSNSQNEFTCRVFKTGTNDFNWDDGTEAKGGDKQWMVIDRTGGIGEGNIYSFWTSYWSICYPGMFTRSTDGNASYEDCVDVQGDPNWGTMAVGPDGELYIVGEGTWDEIIVAKSTNAQNPDLAVEWDGYSQVLLDGVLTGWTPVNPQGLLGQSYVDVDVSNGPTRGNVYVLASVDRSSNTDPGDVMFARSTDGGETWEAPIKINDDASTNNYQWMGVMSVAPNGRIDAAWLDTRDAPVSNPLVSSLYYSFSTDGGLTWASNIRLSEGFDPTVGWPQQQKMGDYFDMLSDEDYAHLAWANTLNGEQDVNYARISPLVAGLGEMGVESYGLRTFPNPVTEQASIRYQLNRSTKVELSVIDIFGKTVKTLIDESQLPNSYNYTFDATDLANGIYFLRLTTAFGSATKKLIVQR